MSTIQIVNEKFNIPAYVAVPKSGGKAAIIVIHEVWGLNKHIESIADKLAAEGYLALAPDLISHTGITKKIDQSVMAEIKNPATRDEAQKKMRAAMSPIMSPEFAKETVERLQLCFGYIKQEYAVENIAVMGFCFGGTYSYSLAAHEPTLKAALPFYGHAPKDEKELAGIQCPVMAFYGEQDTGLLQDLPELETSMKKLKKDFTYKIYPNTGHAFMNDTNPSTYNPKAAKDAWQLALTFLKKNI